MQKGGKFNYQKRAAIIKLVVVCREEEKCLLNCVRGRRMIEVVCKYI